jgi:dihydrofolate reductase
MGKIVVTQFITLDGVVEDPGGAEHFVHGGWGFQSLNDEYFNYKHAELFASGALLLGRITFESLEAAWPGRTDATGLAGRMAAIPKHVLSSTMNSAKWSNTIIIRPPFLPDILALRGSTPRDILVMGSRKLVHLLIINDLVDEYRLLLHPILLGSGHKLFGASEVRKLNLTSTRPFTTGAVLLTYVPDRSRVVHMRASGKYPGQASSSSR